MLRLALPLVLAEVGWMSMGVIDIMMVGRLPDAATAIGSIALAQILFNTFAYGVGGVLLGLDTVVAQAHGAGEIREANRWFVHGMVLAVSLAAALIVGFATAPVILGRMSSSPAVVQGAIRTLRALNFGTLPLLLYFAQRRYLQAFNQVRVIASALVSANLVNLFFNWLLIYDHAWNFALGSKVVHLRFAGHGVEGSGLSTSLARLYLALFLAAGIALADRRHSYGLRSTPRHIVWPSLRRLLALGLPAGSTIIVEIVIFLVVTVLIARLGAAPLAGHEVALNCVSFTFMVPLGISAAAAVRVGQAAGRHDLSAARRAGWTALLLSGGFMSCMALLYLTVPHLLARIFSPDPLVIAAAVPLFLAAALFQLCDGLQVTAIGALRGFGDTHSGLLTHLCCYWLLGLPLGLYLCFRLRMGARGLWLGLSAALIVAGVILLLRWNAASRRPLAHSPNPSHVA